MFRATCNATDEESIARQVAACVLHAATYLVASHVPPTGGTRDERASAWEATYLATCRKVEAQSTFPATRKRNFSLRDMLRRGDVTCANSSAACFASPLRCMLQKKLPHVAVPLIKEARNNIRLSGPKNPEVICRKLIR